MQPELLIFDCDGVLVDSELIGCRVDVACLAEIGIVTSVEEVLERYLGISEAAMFADLERRHCRVLPADFSRTMRERLVAAFETELRPMPGIDAALQALPYRRCVASSSTPARIQHSLSLTGLWALFAPHVFSATQVARGKPAPDLFLFAAASMQAEPAGCVVIEDSEAGARAAVAAGMQVIGFTGGGHCRPDHADRLRAVGAKAVCNEMVMLPALIDGI